MKKLKVKRGDRKKKKHWVNLEFVEPKAAGNMNKAKLLDSLT